MGRLSLVFFKLAATRVKELKNSENLIKVKVQLLCDEMRFLWHYGLWCEGFEETGNLKKKMWLHAYDGPWYDGMWCDVIRCGVESKTKGY